MYDEEIKVTVVASDGCDDWVVLQRTDGIQFDSPVLVEFQTPQVEDYLILYHCPVELFDRKIYPDISSSPGNWSKVAYFTSPKIVVSGGGFAGSSGGVLVNRSSKAVGLFLRSVNAADPSGSAHKVARSAATVYAAFGEGLSIASIPALLAFRLP